MCVFWAFSISSIGPVKLKCYLYQIFSKYLQNIHVDKVWNPACNSSFTASQCFVVITLCACCSEMGRYCSLLKREFWTSDILQSKKQRLKEKIEADVGALVQFLLDERDFLLDALDDDEGATMAVIDDNLKIVEKEAKAVDKAIADIHSHISGKTSFEVSLSYEVCELDVSAIFTLLYSHEHYRPRPPMCVYKTFWYWWVKICILFFQQSLAKTFNK